MTRKTNNTIIISKIKIFLIFFYIKSLVVKVKDLIINYVGL